MPASKRITPTIHGADPFNGSPYRICKRPNAGETVATRFGPAVIVRVKENGRQLIVRTVAHGTETIERAERGHWTVKADAPY